MIEQIMELKRKRNAVILAHNYMPPEIYSGIADITGDSFALAKKAENLEADIIVVCGVLFMAETVKLLNPDKTVLIPDPGAGCSLADSITANDIMELREKFPGSPVITYVNTSAEVKAASDICCTSGNVLRIIESLPEDEVILVPDCYLSAYAQERTTKTIHHWNGTCEVHRDFTGADISHARKKFNGNLAAAAHPECPPEVIKAADFTGSTAAIWEYMEKHRPRNALILTEQSMIDNMTRALPGINFLKSRRLCPHMQKITLEKVLKSLETVTFQVTVPEEHTSQARVSLSRMLAKG